MDLRRSETLPRVSAMKGYGQFCPVAVACEVFAGFQPEKLDVGGLVAQRPEGELCLKDPGFDVDVVVTAEAAAMAALPSWLVLSHYAHVERPVRAG
jgi:hypothetical protein